MILEVCWDGLLTRSFGLSQFHGHGSWLVCEEALCQVDAHGHASYEFIAIDLVNERHLRLRLCCGPSP